MAAWSRIRKSNGGCFSVRLNSSEGPCADYEKMKSSFVEHKSYISSVGALLPYSPRTSSEGFEGGCDVWHHRVNAPKRLSRDSLQRLSKSSAFHRAREKYKLIKTVAILDGWFSYLHDCTVLIHQVFVASVWELLSQLFHSTWIEFIIEYLDSSSRVFTTLSEPWQITINLGNGIFLMIVMLVNGPNNNTNYGNTLV